MILGLEKGVFMKKIAVFILSLFVLSSSLFAETIWSRKIEHFPYYNHGSLILNIDTESGDEGGALYEYECIYIDKNKDFTDTYKKYAIRVSGEADSVKEAASKLDSIKSLFRESLEIYSDLYFTLLYMSDAEPEISVLRGTNEKCYFLEVSEDDLRAATK